MKLTMQTVATVLATEKKEASGDYGESYKMAIMQGSEVGTFPCTKDAFDAVKPEMLMKPNTVHITSNEYNGKTTLRITGVVPPQR